MLSQNANGETHCGCSLSRCKIKDVKVIFLHPYIQNMSIGISQFPTNIYHFNNSIIFSLIKVNLNICPKTLYFS